MLDSLELYSKDSVDDDFESTVDSFYGGLESGWSRTVPKSSQATSYEPDQLVVREGYDNLNFRVPCFRNLN